MAKKMVGVWLQEKDYGQLQKLADQQERSMGSIGTLLIKLLLQNRLTATGTTLPRLISDSQVPSSKIITPNFQATETESEDETYDFNDCPVCGTSVDDLGNKSLLKIKNREDGGTWSCRNCFAHGLWWDHRPPTVEDSSGELPLANQ